MTQTTTRSTVAGARATPSRAPHVLYLVFDLTDPAVRRRVRMLEIGGARVTLAGFRRPARPIVEIDGVVPIDLGQTEGGKYAQRLLAVTRAVATLRRRLSGVAAPDVIVARNLEMLAPARRARGLFGGSAIPLVYECLDIHRLMLRRDPMGTALRASERALARDVSLLLTSSPGFVTNYFSTLGRIEAPTRLVENKFFDPANPVAVFGEEIDAARSPGPPWRIGWFGTLRCRRTFDILSQVSRRLEGRVEIVVRGWPAPNVFADFENAIGREPWMHYGGRYRNPEDLAQIYRQVHFAWLIDFYEAGQNSDWLLPNRLYEGCRFGAVPIARADTETGRFLDREAIGLSLREPLAETLEQTLRAMSPERFGELEQSVTTRDPRLWTCDARECRDLVHTLLAAPAVSADTCFHSMSNHSERA